ncbi:hypothetical protein UC34_18735 [Pandoraea vervacti]|uniref:Uncharacterized protein n=1 Tax=Pandoraea vervacti TaxID=656178 RepID=A0ABN4FS11_9BURK|nr:hypothetical protein UC34_18735 [Pandoraea vervacti]
MSATWQRTDTTQHISHVAIGIAITDTVYRNGLRQGDGLSNDAALALPFTHRFYSMRDVRDTLIRCDSSPTEPKRNMHVARKTCAGNASHALSLARHTVFRAQQTSLAG